ncbi:hypothetical protein ACPOL_1525 [Acidisarcina polymorpha]|uniref:Uncharacterized protein n=1 Tax=Acidisarcina polymorpha TaxID=2211140 RepID=A0A2Z5FVJ4_9BACT|nr:hypothetical protein ACPOL_1525 [Acidisarcina polymorpha]
MFQLELNGMSDHGILLKAVLLDLLRATPQTRQSSDFQTMTNRDESSIDS